MQPMPDSQLASSAPTERMLALLADQASEHAILLLGLDGRVTWWSHGAERLFALPREKALGLNFTEIFTREDRQAGISNLEIEVADSDAISEDDRWHVRADGSTFWSSGALIAIRDPRGEVVGFGKIVRDRTDIKEQITLLENQLAQARNSDSGKDLLITKLTHELRNVVAGIEGGLRLLVKPSEEQTSQRVTEMMQQQLAVMRRLTEDLSDVKRLHAHKSSMQLEQVIVQDVLRHVLEQLTPSALQKSQDIRLLCPAAPMKILADPIRLHQIFSNLVDNAVKYTPPTGRIWIKATIEDKEAVIHIEDTGRGIPSALLTRIFDLFTQVDDSAASGLGIGLALVRELVELHGGSVQAISKGVGLGSEFSVRLPMAPPQLQIDRASAPHQPDQDEMTPASVAEALSHNAS